MNHILIKNILILTLLGLNSNCGTWIGKPKDNTKPTENQNNYLVEKDRPKDSQGNTAQINLTVQLKKSQSTQLIENEALYANDDIIINQVRINLAAVKLKASSEADEQESTLDEKLKEEREEKLAVYKAELQQLEEQWTAAELKTDQRLAAASTEEEEEEILADWRAQQKAFDEREADIFFEVERAERDFDLENDPNNLLKTPTLIDFQKSTSLAVSDIEGDVFDGTYSRLELLLSPRRAKDDEDILNHAVYVFGEVRVDGKMKAFIYTFDGTRKLSIQSKNGLSISSTALANEIIAAFDISSWVEGIEFDDLKADEKEPDLVIINSEANEPYYDRFINNIFNSSTVGRDEDGDELLEDNEI